MYELRHHPLNNVIMKKAKEFMNAGLHSDEAIEPAVVRQKSAFFHLVKQMWRGISMWNLIRYRYIRKEHLETTYRFLITYTSET